MNRESAEQLGASTFCEVDYGLPAARSAPGVPVVPALVRCPVVTVNNFVQVPLGAQDGPWEYGPCAQHTGETLVWL